MLSTRASQQESRSAAGGEAGTSAVARASEARASAARKGTPVDALRAFGMMAGPSALLDLFLAGSVAATLRWRLARPRTRLGRLLRPVAGFGSAAMVAYVTVIRPWMLRWGTTAEEHRMPLPGDELVPHPAVSSTRAITVNAPAEAVWPWLAQIGQDRGGFYSYTWLENLAGCDMTNAERIHPEWQRREIGEVVKLHWATGCTVTSFEPGHVLVLQGWGSFVVEPVDATHSRVILRSRTLGGWPAVFQVLLIELPHFLMERKMLLGIKRRAERAYASAGAGTRVSSGG